MRIIQVIGIFDNKFGKIHLKDGGAYLCGLGIDKRDKTNKDKFKWFKGFCLSCKKIYELDYEKDFKFLIIKFKFRC